MSKLLLIIAIQLLYVPLMTFRSICMIKNLKLLTAVIGFVEVLVYILGLSIVLSGDQTLLEKVVYALAYGIGLAVGMLIEEKLAIGYLIFTVNINHSNEQLITLLRERGYGVTVFVGEGREGKRYQLEILTRRSKEKECLDLINQSEPNAFVVSYAPTRFQGGYLSKLVNPFEGTSVRNHPKE